MTLFKKTKLRRNVAKHSSLPVRHTTRTSSIPMGLILFLVVVSLIMGVYTGCHLMVASVYHDCANQGKWAWTSPLLLPVKPITCSVDANTRQLIGK